MVNLIGSPRDRRGYASPVTINANSWTNGQAAGLTPGTGKHRMRTSGVQPDVSRKGLGVQPQAFCISMTCNAANQSGLMVFSPLSFQIAQWIEHLLSGHSMILIDRDLPPPPFR